jgi:hypothetical protein
MTSTRPVIAWWAIATAAGMTSAAHAEVVVDPPETRCLAAEMAQFSVPDTGIGRSAAISGDVAVVGAWGHAFVYQFEETDWIQAGELSASDPPAGWTPATATPPSWTWGRTSFRDCPARGISTATA